MSALVAADDLSCDLGGGGFFARLSGRHRPIRAVNGVTLALRRGETVGLVGESGSGKSTIGRLLLGLMQPSAGIVRFDGIDLATADPESMRRLRRRMQVVFQDPYSSLDPRRRVGSQIADGLVIHGLVPSSDRMGRIAELLGKVGLRPEAGERFPHAFSGGERQRIAIARALATEPEFLVAVMYLGRIMEEGPTSEVFANPRHPYTQALLSAAPSPDPQHRRRRIVLKGEPPSPAHPPSGCVFRTRCPHALAACAEAVPLLRTKASGHRAACIRDDL